MIKTSINGFFAKLIKPDAWSLITFFFILLLLGPFVALVIVAMGDSNELWGHLIQTVFPRYLKNTLLLMAGVGALSLILGIVSAWMVARFRFPGVTIIEWSLLLPATIPAYIIAYTYTDLLEFAGPVQGLIRDYFGWTQAGEYWFPEIRSLGGAIFVMSFVLYPYIYLMTKTALRLTSPSYIELARLSKPLSAVWVDLYLARPAIIAGLALVLMEVLSDFGTVEYFTVETITLGIFNIWLGMNNLTAAAQIAGLAFIFIIFLLALEQRARSRQKFFDATKSYKSLNPRSLPLSLGLACTIFCLIPIIVGFAIPVTILATFVFRGLAITNFDLLISASLNSIMIALASALVVVLLAFVMVSTTVYRKKRYLNILSNISAMGYAFPGAILAIGVVSFGGWIDSGLEYLDQNLFYGSFDGFLIGGIGLLIFACVLRFQAIGHGAINSGITRLSPNIMNASFVLGRGYSESILLLGPPLLRKSLFAAGLLVFVDVMKELPMTLLLRPFNFETLSTYVYQFAKDELLEESALAALTIIIVGLGPVILMNSSGRK